MHIYLELSNHARLQKSVKIKKQEIPNIFSVEDGFFYTVQAQALPSLLIVINNSVIVKLVKGG